MKALILFAHGARDPRWAEPFERLKQRVQTLAPETPVQLAFLEMMTPGLGSAADELIAAGCRHLVVVPIFLGQGGHVRRDLPEIVGQVRAAHPGVQIECSAAAGEDAAVLDAIAAFCLGQLTL